MPPVTIINAQKLFKLNTVKLRNQAQILLKILNLKDYDVGIKIVTDTELKRINLETRGINKPTDVITLPNFDLKPGERPGTFMGTKDLGDMIFGMGYIMNYCKENDVQVHDRMAVLLVHSMLHLLGYDHIKDSDFEVMQKKELELMKQLKEAESSESSTKQDRNIADLD
jgi:probable rRNA maturation factor